VILAAGDGGRLGKHTLDLPKPLIPVGGRPLIDYTIEALVGAGVEDIVIVVGYRAGQLESAIAAAEITGADIRFVENPRYESGASLPLRAAREICGDEPFLLLMADHLLPTALVRRLLTAPQDPDISLVGADASTWPQGYSDEATRIVLEPGSHTVRAIGKGLSPWDALDTGAFLLAPNAWDAVDAVAEDCELSDIFQEVARRRQLETVDVSGASWYDVDTAEDLAAAQRLIASGAR
jgi:choline kinase